MTTSSLLACIVGLPCGFVIWSAVFRLPDPFAKWALQPFAFARPGPVSMAIATILATIFMMAAGSVALVGVAEIIALPAHFADARLRRLVLAWSALGYILPLIAIRVEIAIRKKRKT